MLLKGFSHKTYFSLLFLIFIFMPSSIQLIAFF